MTFRQGYRHPGPALLRRVEPYSRRPCTRTDDVMGMPIDSKTQEIYYRGKWRTPREWARHYGLTTRAVRQRVRDCIAIDADFKGTYRYVIKSMIRNPSLETQVAMLPRFWPSPPRQLT